MLVVVPRWHFLYISTRIVPNALLPARTFWIFAREFPRERLNWGLVRTVSRGQAQQTDVCSAGRNCSEPSARWVVTEIEKRLPMGMRRLTGTIKSLPLALHYDPLDMKRRWRGGPPLTRTGLARRVG
jgi:hypothetical protein